MTSLNPVKLNEPSPSKDAVKGDTSYPWFDLSITPYPGCSLEQSTVSIPTYMTDKVIQEAIIDVNEIKANILEDLAQTQQSWALAVDIVRLVVELLLAMRRRDFRLLRRKLKDAGLPQAAAKSWLAFFYGIKPLIGTLDAILQSDPRPIQRMVQKTTKEYVDALPFAGVPLDSVKLIGGKAFRSARCGLLVRYNVTDDRRHWQSLGLSSSLWNDLQVTAWALLPLSFVIDWFVPVERYLRSGLWSSGLELRAGYVGRRLEAHAVFERTTKGITYVGECYGQFPTVLVDHLQYNRSAFNDFPPPSGISFNAHLNVTRLISAAALVTVFTGFGKPKRRKTKK